MSAHRERGDAECVAAAKATELAETRSELLAALDSAASDVAELRQKEAALVAQLAAARDKADEAGQQV